MHLPTMRNWFGPGRPLEAPAEGIAPPEPADAAAKATPADATAPAMPDGAPLPAVPAAPGEPQPAWSAARIELADALWGEGFTAPGGAEEVMRLARPLGMTGASTVLLLGTGSGGPLRTLASGLGAWVDGYSADADLAAIATRRAAKAGLAKRARVAQWDPSAPDFRSAYVRHAMALEPVSGARADIVIPAVLGALKGDGQIAMTELVADTAGGGKLLARWAELERRSAEPPSESAVTALFTRLGYDVPVVEDVSARHARLALEGWHRLLHELRAKRPEPAQAKLLVSEAERWLLRLRLIQSGTLRMVRWHAIGRG